MGGLQGELGRCDPWLKEPFQGMGRWWRMGQKVAPCWWKWLAQLVAISLSGCRRASALSWEAAEE